MSAPLSVAADVATTISGAKVLVTGGSGFIGSHLVERLVDLGARVTIADQFPPDRAFARDAVWWNIDIGSEEFGRALRQAPAFDLIFHLAGRAYAADSVGAPLADFDANLLCTFRLLEHLRVNGAATHLLFASSAAVYGDPPKLPIDETDVTLPISPYGVSKLAAERYAAVYSRVYGLPVTSLRLFSVFGPRQRKQVVYDLLSRLRSSPRELLVHGDGTQTRDLVYVADVVDAFLVAAARGARDGSVYNVATGSSTSTAELARLIVGLGGGVAAIRFSLSVRRGDPQNWLGNAAGLRALGWAPRCTVELGLAETARWLDREAAVPVGPAAVAASPAFGV